MAFEKTVSKHLKKTIYANLSGMKDSVHNKNYLVGHIFVLPLGIPSFRTGGWGLKCSNFKNINT